MNPPCHFHYLAGNTAFNTLMTESRAVQSMLAISGKRAVNDPSANDIIVRNVTEADYNKISLGSPVVVDLLARCGQAGQFSQDVYDRFVAKYPDQAEALKPFIGLATPLASLTITDRFGDVKYNNIFDGSERRDVISVIDEEKNRPFTDAERRIVANVVGYMSEAVNLGLLRAEDMERIERRALGPVLKKMEFDIGLDGPGSDLKTTRELAVAGRDMRVV